MWIATLLRPLEFPACALTQRELDRYLEQEQKKNAQT